MPLPKEKEVFTYGMYKTWPDDDITTVVQPDILVVCDNEKLDDKGCKGAPDLIIEILSPSTASKDMKEKFFLYEKHGVEEYWIVEPLDKFIMVYSLQEGTKYGRAVTYTKDDKIESGVLKDFVVDLDLVFAD